jgi:putative colanic acid biosynthesis acetyltransferase WcaF
MMNNGKDILVDKVGFIGPTFGLSNRILRSVWTMVWLLMGAWTPAPLHRWRITLLKLFGANISWHAYVYGTSRVWAPWNLHMEDYATLGPYTTIYNIAAVRLASRVVVSQGAHICTGSHDFRLPDFPLISKDISVGRRAWICAGAFVGPGVAIGEGVVLGAHGVAFSDLEPWTVYRGNPALPIKQRPVIYD